MCIEAPVSPTQYSRLLEPFSSHAGNAVVLKVHAATAPTTVLCDTDRTLPELFLYVLSPAVESSPFPSGCVWVGAGMMRAWHCVHLCPAC